MRLTRYNLDDDALNLTYAFLDDKQRAVLSATQFGLMIDQYLELAFETETDAPTDTAEPTKRRLLGHWEDLDEESLVTEEAKAMKEYYGGDLNRAIEDLLGFMLPSSDEPN